MRRLSNRQRVIGGALVLAVLVWVADWLIGDGPTPLQAGQAAPLQTQVVTAKWRDVTDLVARLTEAEYASVAEELDQLQRDLFMPSMLIESVFSVEVPEEPPEPITVKESEVPELDFATRHKLEGVVIGSRPLAVIDDRVLPLNSDLEGYTLIGVQRDGVIFRHSITQVLIRLELEQRPGEKVIR
ncbi:MAG: hypothetical protein KAY37_00015 [Phycisphaerae bacterium]|nr:hypothetical protein [Phycisphaerae bacterium]